MKIQRFFNKNAEFLIPNNYCIYFYFYIKKIGYR